MEAPGGSEMDNEAKAVVVKSDAVRADPRR